MIYRSLILMALPFFGLVACDDIIPSCKLERVEVNADVFVVNGEMDAGFVVDVFTKRTAQDGQVTINVVLSSTEGDVRKRRTVFLEKDKLNKVSFQVHEPTIAAQQVSASASCEVS